MKQIQPPQLFGKHSLLMFGEQGPPRCKGRGRVAGMGRDTGVGEQHRQRGEQEKNRKDDTCLVVKE